MNNPSEPLKDTKLPYPLPPPLPLPSPLPGCLSYSGPTPPPPPPSLYEGRLLYRPSLPLSSPALPFYEGTFCDSLFHGEGKLLNPLFGHYSGSFINGQRHGRGSESWGPVTYDGHWKFGLFDGEGTLTEPDRRYHGTWAQGKEEGYGKEEAADGVEFKGQWHQGRRHGYGEYRKAGKGYSYFGMWAQGVRQGIGVERQFAQEGYKKREAEINEKKEESEGPEKEDGGESDKLNTEKKIEPYIYEGEFWNNRKNGIGKYLDNDGNYYFGNWTNNKMDGLIFQYRKSTNDWILTIYDMGIAANKPLQIYDQVSSYPAYLDGYSKFLKVIHKNVLIITDEFTDDVFKPQLINYYTLLNKDYFLEDLRTHDDKLEAENIRWIKLSKMVKDMSFSSEILTQDKKSAIYPRIEFGKIGDPQLIGFLIALVRRPEITEHMFYTHTSEIHKFYCVYVYLTNHQLIQKYPLAVDDYFPTLEDGSNLFTQLQSTGNVLLAVLEKIWMKYARLHNLNLDPNSIYIEKIIMAFLGTATKKILVNTDHEIFDFAELSKARPERGMCFAFRRFHELRDTTESKFKFKMPYRILKVIRIQKHYFVALEAADREFSLCDSNSDYVEDLRNQEENKDYFSKPGEEKPIRFVLESKDFTELFSSVYISNFLPDEKRHYKTVLRNTNEMNVDMTYVYLNFEAYTGTRLSISVIQDHILKSGIPKNINPPTVPIRVVIGRYNINKLRDTKKKGLHENLLKSLFIENKIIKALREAVKMNELSNKNKSQIYKNQLLQDISLLRAEQQNEGPVHKKVTIKEDSDKKKDDKRKNKKKDKKKDKKKNLDNRTNSKDSSSSSLSSDSKSSSSSDIKNRSLVSIDSSTGKRVSTVIEEDTYGLLSKQSTAKRVKDEPWPFQTDMEGILSYYHELKFVTAFGQSIDINTIEQDILIEQGFYIIQLQIERDQSSFEKISSLRFHVEVQSSLGTLNLDSFISPKDFMVRCYTDATIRFGKEMMLKTEGETSMRTYQHFFTEGNIYCQVFVNNSKDKIWVHKTSFQLQNMAILNSKDSRKPISLIINPGQEKVILIQQIRGGAFNMIGGEGSYFTKPFKKLERKRSQHHRKQPTVKD